MDALSQILNDIHLNQAEYFYLNTHGDWAFTVEKKHAVIAYIVLSGEIFIQLEPQTLIFAQTGDVILLPAGSAHRCSASSVQQPLIETLDFTEYFDKTPQQGIDIGTTATTHNQLMAIHSQLDSLMAKPLLDSLPTYIYLQSLANHRTPEWLQIGLSFLALETQQTRPGRDKIIDHLISILFIECIRDHILHLDDTQSWLRALSHPQLSQALTAIHGKPGFAWTVELLAHQCHMSRSKFASEFHQLLGTTPFAYLQQHRMNLACQLLRAGQRSIQQIAQQLGYSSDVTFSQRFKKQLNISPKRYQKLFFAAIQPPST